MAIVSPKCPVCPIRGDEVTPCECTWIDAAFARAREADRARDFPSLVEQAANLAGAVGRFVASGFAMAPAEERARRMGICQACPEFVGGRCRRCGCNLAAKVASAAEHCPISKW